MKFFLVLLGCISLLLGVIGIFFPLLPTTPFLLLAATCFFRSSERLYKWLLEQKFLGKYILNFREHKAIPLHAKICSVLLVWATILYVVIEVFQDFLPRVLLIVLALLVSAHILSYKTLKSDNRF